MFPTGIREAFMSGDHEPWVFRGGLAADLQRLMPVDSGNDLFLYQYPESPVSEVFHIRPFRPSDEEECYRVCLQTWDDGMDASQDFPSHPTLVGEISIGPLLTFYPGLGFVFENSEGQIVGYIFSAPCLATYRQKVRHAWLPQLREKYPLVEQGEGELLTPCDLTINSIHRDSGEPIHVKEAETYGVCKLSMLASLSDASLARRATTLLLACLRTTGTLKVISEVPRKERYMIDLYTKLGFTQMSENGEALDSPEDSPSNHESGNLSPESLIMFRRY